MSTWCVLIKANHILEKFYPDLKKGLGSILCRNFHLHPISCQKSSLGYVTLQHLTLQKHLNQENCCHCLLMTGKRSQWKWKQILLIFDCMMNAVPCHNKWSSCLWKMKVSYKWPSLVEVLKTQWKWKKEMCKIYP